MELTPREKDKLLLFTAGLVAERVGWSSFFLFTVAAALPAFLLMLRLTPWNGAGPRGAFDPAKDPT